MFYNDYKMSYSSQIRDLEKKYKREKERDNSNNWAKEEMIKESQKSEQEQGPLEETPNKYLSEAELYDSSPRYSHTTSFAYTRETYLMIFFILLALGLAIAALVISLT